VNLEDKLRHLEISEEMESRVRALPFREYDGPPRKNMKVRVYEEIIELSKLVGVDRPFVPADNWIDFLKDCYKLRNFKDNFSVQSYKNLLLDPSKNELPNLAPPAVFLYNGNYYIDGEGKHRLTIGKCIEATHAKVVVVEALQ
jgi:hypothetical protein